MRFWKVQAIGNDFPLIRLEDADTAELPALAIAMADRRYTFAIRHLERTVAVSIDGARVATVLGKASYVPADVPHTASGELFDTEIVPGHRGSALTTGSTHTILWMEELPLSPAFEMESEALENDLRFPLRTSVIWTRQDDEDAISIRIWERGVGETLGCGSGSTAAAADLMRRRGRGGRIEVRNRGGSVSVSAESWDAPLTIEGTAETVYSGLF
ncbi:hypothetical protein EON79_07825 [bacterium]|nr:MAG: hypothetical protein EON79_07825 [bacterium]